MSATMQSLWYDHYQGAVYPLDLFGDPTLKWTKIGQVKSLVSICANYIVRDSTMTLQALDIIPQTLCAPLMQEALFSNKDRAMEVLLSHWPLETMSLKKFAPDIFSSLLPLYNFVYLSDIVRQGMRYTTTLAHTFIESLKKRTPTKLKYLDLTGYPTAEVMLYYLATHCMLAHNEVQQNVRVQMYNKAVKMVEREADLPPHLLAVDHALPEECCVIIKLDAFVTSDSTHSELCKALKVSSFNDRKMRLCIEKLGTTGLGESRINLLLRQLDPQHLSGLHLKYNSLTCNDIIKLGPIFKTLTNLTALDMSCNCIYFYHSDVTCEVISEVFRNLSHLTRLDLSNNRIKTKLRRILSDIPQPLQYLRLAACGLTVSDITYLSKSHHTSALQELDLSENCLSSSCRNLSQLLITLAQRLLVLELEDCALGDEHLLSFLPQLSQMSSLLFLNLAENSLSCQAVQRVTSTVSCLLKVQVFKVSHPKDCYEYGNDIDEEHAKVDSVNLLQEVVNASQQRTGRARPVQLVIVELERVLDLPPNEVMM